MKRLRDLANTLSEKNRRRFAAIEATQRGCGRISYIAGVIGCSAKTIERGIVELDQLAVDPSAGRRRYLFHPPFVSRSVLPTRRYWGRQLDTTPWPPGFVTPESGIDGSGRIFPVENKLIAMHSFAASASGFKSTKPRARPGFRTRRRRRSIWASCIAMDEFAAVAVLGFRS